MAWSLRPSLEDLLWPEKRPAPPTAEEVVKRIFEALPPKPPRSPHAMTDLIEKARFLASGQDDPHSVTLSECADALAAQAAEIQNHRKAGLDVTGALLKYEAMDCTREGDEQAAWADVVDGVHVLGKRADTLAARVAEMEAALTEAEDTLQLCEQPSLQDPAHRDAVASIGGRIGYGALMSNASALWREHLIARGLKGGGEFVSGPCHSTVVGTLKVIRAALHPKAPAPADEGEKQ